MKKLYKLLAFLGYITLEAANLFFFSALIFLANWGLLIFTELVVRYNQKFLP